MKGKRKYFVWLCFFLLLLSACKKTVHDIPPALLPYVQDFFEEARSRGLDLEMSDFDLIIELRQIDDHHIAGRCRNGKMIIDSIQWNYRDEKGRRSLLFHEMGHCVLGRGHDNIKTLEGACYSMMHGSEDDFECSENFYSELWWEYYLDELFLDTPSLPAWYTEKREYDLLGIGTKERIVDTTIVKINGPAVYTSASLGLSQFESYCIEFSFSNWFFTDGDAEFYFGGLNFGMGQNFFGDYVNIRSTNGRKSYFSSKDISIDNNSRLSIIRKGKMLIFYVDGKFVHAMEEELLDSDKLYTNEHVNPVRIKLTVDVLR